MRLSFFTAAAAPLAVLAMEAPASGFFEAPGLVRFPISAHRGAGLNLVKRQEQIPLANQETGYYYTIDIDVGTPPQRVTVFFDTGSGELWVNPNCSTAANTSLCNSFGRFDESSSFVDLNLTNILRYGGQRFAIIRYGYDFVTVGSAKINQQIFGVALESNGQPAGILGVGPSLRGWDSPYPYVLDNLYKQNFINSRSFSLDLRSVNVASGAVIFGGIDLKKFTGKLEKRPIIPASESPDKRTRYWIHLDGISITGEDGTKQTTIFNSPNAQPVLLDSGYTISALPKEAFAKILAAFPSARLDETTNQYLVDCSITNTQGSVDFTFGNTTIKVPYRDFVWQQPSANVCVLGVVEATSFAVLGDTFLRAAYAVYDYDNRNIYLANAKVCGSELIAIGSGPDAVPAGLEGQCLGVAGSSSLSSTLTFAASSSTSSSEPVSISASSNVIGSPTSEEISTRSSISTSTIESTSSSNSVPESTSLSSAISSSTSETTKTTSPASASVASSTSTSFLSTSASALPTSSLWTSDTSVRASTEETTSTLSPSTPISSSSFDSSTGSLTLSSQTDGSTVSSKVISSSSGPTRSQDTKFSTVKVTKIYNSTSCAPFITYCPVGQVTTEVTMGTSVSEPSAPSPQPSIPYVKPDTPQVTRSVVIPQVICPGNAGIDCNKDELVTTSVETVIVPITPNAKPTPIPSCALCQDEKKTPPSNTGPSATNIDTQGPFYTSTTKPSGILTAIMGPLVEPFISSPGRELPTNVTATAPIIASVTGESGRVGLGGLTTAGIAFSFLLQFAL